MKRPELVLMACGLLFAWSHPLLAGGTPKRMTPEERIQLVLDVTAPLKHPLGDRLPLYVWAVLDVPGEEAQVVRTLRSLAERGIAACASWSPGPAKAQSLDRALRIGAIQKRLGLRVNINANACTYSIFDGSEGTAHVDADGKPFFDRSSDKRPLGCPFAMRHRFPAMREQVEGFVRAYQEKGVPVDFVFADWEVDGPIEWNDGWAAARRCTRCRQHIPNIGDFLAFQRAYRALRAEATRACYTRPVLDHFPKALVGNYAVHPTDGWRYWYDYFEVEPTDAAIPVRREQRAVYRPWPDEFTPSGYTFAMPVIYTREHIGRWYDWPSHDFRWFYTLLLEGSGVGQHTPASVPITSFVNYTSCSKPKGPDDPVKPMTEAAWKELLWHLLLRGHDAFFLWCPEEDLATELRPLHRVFAESLEFKEFLDSGEPVAFDVPAEPGPVLSALRLGNRLLVRRTDFTDDARPAMIRMAGAVLPVPPRPGKCQVLIVPGWE